VYGTAVFVIKDMNFVCYTPAIFPAPSGVVRILLRKLKHQTVDFTTSEVHSYTLFIVNVAYTFKYISVICPITGPRYPEGSRKLRFPDYVTITQDGGKVISLTHWPLFTPRKYSWYSFMLEAESTPGP